MAKYDDDQLNGLTDLDDDDLFLLDMDAGEFNRPSSKSKAEPNYGSFEEDESSYSSSDSDHKSARSRRHGGGHGGLIALIIILVVLIIAIVAFLFRLNAVGGDLSKVFKFSSSSEISVTSDEAEEEEYVDGTDEVIEEEETDTEEAAEEEEETEDEAEAEAETEEEAAEEEEEDTESVDLSDLALLQLWGEDFTPDLVYVTYYGVHQASGDLQVDSSIATNLAAFIAAAREAGYSTMLSRCYVEADDSSEAEVLEHATGLAVDFVDYNQQVRASFASDESYADEIAWLADNAAEYGFILRYPEGKEDLTGVDYIPYHFVYVGTTIAEEMAENDWCLEEYLEQ